MEKSSSDFEALWNKTQSEPSVQKVTSANKVEANLSIHDLMDRYVETARVAVSQNKLSREAFDELTNQTRNYKAALSHLESAGGSTIMGIGRQLRNRLLNRLP